MIVVFNLIQLNTNRLIFQSNLNEQIRFFTGTADKIIKWHKIYKGPLCYYEVIGMNSNHI